MENHHFCSGLPDLEEGNYWAQCQSAGRLLNSRIRDSDSTTTTFQFSGHPSSWPMPFGGGATEEEEERPASAASSSHSQAEKRRRERINAQLETLRKLIPKSDKMDKAALLGSVVEHVKDLKREALEVSKFLTVPTEVDEVTIDCYLDDNKDQGRSSADQTKEISSSSSFFIKVSVCCEDRPELLAELAHALKGLKLTTVRADMACLGGRIKSILILCTSSEDAKEASKRMNGVLIDSLKRALVRIASSSTASTYRIRSKRQRFFLPSSSY